VRRIGGTAEANRALNPTAAEPPRPAKRNPVYIALAVAGVLVLGAGAAIGVPKLVSGGGSSTATKKKQHHKKTATPPPIAPAQVTVTVLNGTTVVGLAAQIGDQAQSAGFNLGSTGQVSGILEGTKAQQANSVVMYLPGHAREARFVARKLHITGAVRAVDQASRQLAGDATVVIVVGRDQTH